MSALIYQGCRLTVGILYPAYCSFKAVRSKNVKEYVKWMMYWIVFALFSFVETFADFILIWFPFYYEVKICFILWLVAPVTKGSSVLYRKVVHPQLLKREKEIDANLSKATDQGYAALITLGSRGLNFATNIVLSTAIKGSSKLSDHLQKSYSLNDLRGDVEHYRPRRCLEANLSIEEEELENRLIGERYRLETAQAEESLDDIDREVDELPVLEAPTDVQRRRRRRKIESTLHEVMADGGPALAQSLVCSVRLPRKHRPVLKEVSAGVPEDLDRSESDRSRPITSPQQTYSSSSSPSSAGTASGFLSHYFRSSDPSSPPAIPSGSLGPSRSDVASSSSGPSGSSGPVSSSGPSSSSDPSVSTPSTDPASAQVTSSTSGTSSSRRLRFGFFSLSSPAK